MSLLAEPKKKVKWGLNPRGNLWANDESKFGQKLLEKMGWQKGRGLGRHENGRTDNIVVVSKDDNKGVGWDDKTSNWVAHQDEFNALLVELNNAHKNDPGQEVKGEELTNGRKEPVSLEVRSKTFKSRVHYKKFVCGKDVSQYSAEDMGGIFGKKFTPGDDISICPQSNSISSSDDKNATINTEPAVKEVDVVSPSEVATFTSSSSVSDYFAQKMKSKNIVLKFEQDRKPRSGFNANNDEIYGIQDIAMSKPNAGKSKKRKRTELTNFSQNNEVLDGGSIEIKTEDAHPDMDSCSIIDVDEHSGSRSQPLRGSSGKDICLKGSQISEKEKLSPASKTAKSKCKMQKKKQTTDVPEVISYETDIAEKCVVNVKSPNLKMLPADKKVDGGGMMSHQTEVAEKQMDSKSRDLQNQNSSDARLKDFVMAEVFKKNTKTLVPISKRLPAGNSDMELLQKYHNLAKKSKDYLYQNNTENWVVTLNQARKLARYKHLHKRIEDHKTLSTSSLLSIVGYGVILDD